ncbi:TPA: hypothetical protein PPN70_004065 [Serratia rubidaea]|nr:hypothetical protein [Serratia rubidaea]HDJ1447203.1 hypothetical protein [Serratia rubidaea]HDJ1463270.1 hypothetical protein [Serratia rubidaea]HDJ2773012.1 hypothetical protein [Serratia rubidaea]
MTNDILAHQQALFAVIKEAESQGIDVEDLVTEAKAKIIEGKYRIAEGHEIVTDSCDALDKAARRI